MLPIIDFSKVQNEEKDEIMKLRSVCSDWGFFYLVNTNISYSTHTNILEKAKQFFDLNIDQKKHLDLSKSKSFSGYIKKGGETTKGKPDLKESFIIVQEGMFSEIHSSLPFYEFDGSNQWPNESWIPNFKRDVTSYIGQMEPVGYQLKQGLVKSLDIPIKEQHAYYHQPLYRRTKFINYERAELVPSNEIRIHAHTDIALFNILLIDKPGLEVQNSQGEWHPVLPIQGAFVVILGELTQLWTNKLYRAGVHRVRNSSLKGQRLSIPFFFYPNLLSPIISNFKAKEKKESPSEPMLIGEMLWRRINTSLKNLKQNKGKAYPLKNTTGKY